MWECGVEVTNSRNVMKWRSRQEKSSGLFLFLIHGSAWTSKWSSAEVSWNVDCWVFPAFSVIASNIQCLQLSSLVRGLWPLNLLFLILSGEATQKNYRAEDEQGSGKTFIGNLGATYCSLKLAWQLQSVCSRCMMWNKANSFISNA